MSSSAGATVPLSQRNDKVDAERKANPPDDTLNMLIAKIKEG